jgi:uncharacterized protein (DUF1778 family)
MARPKKTDALDAKANIGIRVTNELRGKIEEAAKAHGRTMADEVRVRLEQSFRFREAA